MGDHHGEEIWTTGAVSVSALAGWFLCFFALAPTLAALAEPRVESDGRTPAAVTAQISSSPGSDSGNEWNTESSAHRNHSSGLVSAVEAVPLPAIRHAPAKHQEPPLEENADELDFNDPPDLLPESRKNLFLPASGSDYSRDRDPFSPTLVILQAAKRHGGTMGFIPAQGPQSLPPLQLRGYLHSLDMTPGALLEVNGVGTYLVHVGDTISLQRQGGETVLKVKEINKLNVLVEVGTLGHIVVVR